MLSISCYLMSRYNMKFPQLVINCIQPIWGKSDYFCIFFIRDYRSMTFLWERTLKSTDMYDVSFLLAVM